MTDHPSPADVLDLAAGQVFRDCTLDGNHLIDALAAAGYHLAGPGERVVADSEGRLPDGPLRTTPVRVMGYDRLVTVEASP